MDRSPLQQRAAALKSSTGRTASAAEPGRPDRINNLQARRKSMPKADMCGVKIFPLPLQCRNSATGLSLLSVTAKPRHCCGRSRRTAFFVLAGFVGMHTAYVTHANWCNPHRLTRHHIGGRLLAEGHSTLSAWSLSDSHIRTVTEHRGSRVHWPRAAAGQLASSFKGLDSRIPHTAYHSTQPQSTPTDTNSGSGTLGGCGRRSRVASAAATQHWCVSAGNAHHSGSCSPMHSYAYTHVDWHVEGPVKTCTPFCRRPDPSNSQQSC